MNIFADRSTVIALLVARLARSRGITSPPNRRRRR
jgi:hypothetical protein